MVSLQRHQTSHWSSISSSNQRGSGETRTILQTIPEEVEAATQTSLTGVFDAVSPHATQHLLFTKPTPKWSSNSKKIDSLLPSTAHIAQERQATDATKSQQKEQSTVQHVRTRYSVGTPCYALYCGPRHTNSPRWVPATVTKVHGTRSFTVKVHPRGPLWKRHWEQLRPRYGISEDADPGFNYGDRPTPTIDNSTPAPQKDESTTQPPSDETNQQTVPEYGRHNPQRSGRNRKPRHPCNMNC